ncbi:hypothetical protein JW707_03975 [Candidatus Woesearchaeota archaeon]|nr:hypothetical protein [Candidatus Woesearchaeota archaeon]
MDKKTIFVFLVALFVFSSLTLAVFAAEEGSPNAVESILQPFGDRFSEVYTRFYVFIDAAIYLIIFLGLTQISLGKLWEGRGDKKAAKTISVGIAIVLALSLALFEASQGFNIMSFGPLAAIILLALLGYALWAGLKELDVGDPMKRAAGAYVVVYYSLMAVVPSAMWWINRNVPIVAGILALLGAVFSIYIIVMIILWVISLFGKADTGKAAKEIKEAAEKEAKERTTPAPVTEAEKKRQEAEEQAGEKKKKKEEEEEERKKKERDIRELEAALGFLIRAREAINHLIGTVPRDFKAAVEYWGENWKSTKSIPHAKANATGAVKVLRDTIVAPYMVAVSDFEKGIKEVISASHMQKYSDIRDELEKIRVEGEAQMVSEGPLARVIETTNYYHKILHNYLSGVYEGRRAMPPSKLQYTCLRLSKYHIDKQFPKSMKNAYTAVNVIIEKVKNVINKAKK